MSKKLGICLTGGGARGGYQIGALKALEALGLLRNVVTYSGTSIGAANAAVVASRGVAAAEHTWRNLPENNLPRVQKEEKENGRFRINFPDFQRGIYSMEIFESVMHQSIDFDVLKNREVYASISLGGEIDQGISSLLKSTYTHYIRGDAQIRYMPLHELDTRMVLKTIVASASIPIFFSPVEIDNVNCYDGGVFDNIPVEPLVKSGCDEIIIIYLHRNGKRFYNPRKHYPEVTFHEIKHTGRDMGRVLKFSLEQTERLIALGYADTMNYFETLSASDSETQ